MLEEMKIVSVFLASPGDLEQEREILKSSIERLNRIFAHQFGYEVHLIRWENIVGGFGRPQEIINRRLQSCEFFIGLVWNRWGSPPDVTGEHSSGFEEEYELALTLRKETGRPEMQMFFKNIDPKHEIDPGQQLKKVLEFKQRLVDQKILMFKEFETARELEELVQQAIRLQLNPGTRHVRHDVS
jgi:hypothetical protein